MFLNWKNITVDAQGRELFVSEYLEGGGGIE